MAMTGSACTREEECAMTKWRVLRVFKSSWATTTSPGERKTTVYKKRWGWRCDLDSKKTENKLKISLYLMPATQMTAGMGDTSQQMTAGQLTPRYKRTSPQILIIQRGN